MQTQQSVKEAREGAGLSQVEVAHALGISEPTYRKYERHPDRMSLRTAVMLAKVLRLKSFMALKLTEDPGGTT